tara:strand:+ start:117 stop:533 length:417 start_codon:yes stop_codon:yes gene_type:complete
MPKQYHVINDFSGGMNTRKDPRDLRDNELSYIQNMSINNLGKIRTMGFFYDHKEDQDGTTDMSEFIPLVSVGLTGGGGYGLFYFESDHSRVPENTITESRSGEALVVGETSADGNISFVKVRSVNDPHSEVPESGGGA